MASQFLVEFCDAESTVLGLKEGQESVFHGYLTWIGGIINQKAPGQQGIWQCKTVIVVTRQSEANTKLNY